MKHSHDLSWEYQDTVDNGYGEHGADIQVDAVVTFADLEPISATITMVYAFLCDQEGGVFQEMELEDTKLLEALELEAIERARGMFDAEDLAQAEGDRALKE